MSKWIVKEYKGPSQNEECLEVNVRSFKRHHCPYCDDDFLTRKDMRIVYTIYIEEQLVFFLNRKKNSETECYNKYVSVSIWLFLLHLKYHYRREKNKHFIRKTVHLYAYIKWKKLFKVYFVFTLVSAYWISDGFVPFLRCCMKIRSNFIRNNIMESFLFGTFQRLNESKYRTTTCRT